MLHILIGLNTKFQHRLTILIFWTKFAEKWCLRSKADNSYICVCPWSFLTILNFLHGVDRQRYLLQDKAKARKVLVNKSKVPQARINKVRYN